jgi:hypothetical protein
MPHHKVFVQRAHHKHDEFEAVELGDEGVLRCFDEFDWSGELEKVAEFQRVSPTISIEGWGERLIWVSAAGAPGAIEFVSEYTFPGKKRVLFGLMERDATLGFDAQHLTMKLAREALAAYVNRDHTRLEALYNDA